MNVARTSQAHQRHTNHHYPQAVVDRKADYSDKRRRTRKDPLIADPSRYIHYLGPTTSGFTHDFQLLRNGFDANPGLLNQCALLADLGYLGLVKYDDVPAGSLPHRKPRRIKKHPVTALTDGQRADN